MHMQDLAYKVIAMNKVRDEWDEESLLVKDFLANRYNETCKKILAEFDNELDKYLDAIIKNQKKSAKEIMCLPHIPEEIKKRLKKRVAAEQLGMKGRTTKN